ncbi:hypothetical protein GSS88_03115 [Corynebacterium sp. 3HC-13]|uniref:hypothetical protein n=1 Tax=Corynebacterium poyangense TaxID=2684405 RepID=UPI001CCC82A5|nr:hypothetical protein [Corynebacterium poyangense]MBZ8176791.1 hypothetical protein [Corynebacterium poyangense]
MVRTSVLSLEGLSRTDKIATLRAQLVGMGRGEESPLPSSADTVALMPVLARYLPGGGLARHRVTQMSESTMLAAIVIAHISSHGGHVAVVGWPELSYAAIAEAGGDLSYLLAVPNPGAEALTIATVLAEGVDLVVCRIPSDTAQPPLTHSQARSILGKIWLAPAAFLMVGRHLPGTAVEIEAHIWDFHGIGRGINRINQIDLLLCIKRKDSVSREVLLGIQEGGVIRETYLSGGETGREYSVLSAL